MNVVSETRVLQIICVLGLVSYALRACGYLAAGLLAPNGLWARLFRLAPGNLFVAFTVAGMIQGGFPAVMGSMAAAAAMAVTQREWAALAAGFSALVLASG